jgi:hypothetical protein
MKMLNFDNLTALLVVLTVSCSASSEFDSADSGNQRSGSYPDQNSADVPTAVAGGLYLLSCKHDTSVEQLEASSECSVRSRTNGRKLRLASQFLESELTVDTPAGVRATTRKNAVNAASHWTIKFLNQNTNLSMEDILSSSEIKLFATRLDGKYLEPLVTKSSISEVLNEGLSQREFLDIATDKAENSGLKSTTLGGHFYVESYKHNISCTKICSDLTMQVDTIGSDKLLLPKIENCKAVLNGLGYGVEEVYYEGDGTSIGESIGTSAHYNSNVRKMGCSRAKWNVDVLRDPHPVNTQNFDPNLEGLIGIEVRRACSCK